MLATAFQSTASKPSVVSKCPTARDWRKLRIVTACRTISPTSVVALVLLMEIVNCSSRKYIGAGALEVICSCRNAFALRSQRTLSCASRGSSQYSTSLSWWPYTWKNVTVIGSSWTRRLMHQGMSECATRVGTFKPPLHRCTADKLSRPMQRDPDVTPVEAHIFFTNRKPP